MPIAEVNTAMPPVLDSLYTELMEKLDMLRVGSDNILVVSQGAIRIVSEKLEFLRSYVMKNPLKNKNEEIQFFKDIKPRFYSQFIYYLKIFHIETYRPNGSVEAEQEYVYKELGRLQEFYELNKEFYAYYRSGSNYLDDMRFVRGSVDINLALTSHYLDADPLFSTTHDYKLAKILANEMLREYLLDRLASLNFKEKAKTDESLAFPGLTWTASLAAINELIYALKAVGAINNGNTTIAQIGAALEKTFHVKIGNIYRRQQENRLRENRTPFIDQMKTKSIEEMNHTDENPHPSSK
jgi:RteC protein